MGTQLDQLTVNRLAFSRRLLDKAQREAAAPEPYSSEALLTMHDACELFLILTAEHLGVDMPKSVQFEGYWAEIELKANVTLPLETELRRVNKARVQLKHHFILPARGDLERFLIQTRDFFERATPMVFGIELDEVSLISLIRERAVRRWLEKAIEDKGTDEIQALAACAVAYRNAMYAYRRDQWGQQTSRFDISPGGLGIDTESCAAAPDIESWSGDVDRALDDVGTSLETLAVGLDLDRLAQLRQYWPFVQLRERGTALNVIEKKHKPPAGVVEASIEFVTDAALHLQERVRSS